MHYYTGPACILAIFLFGCVSQPIDMAPQTSQRTPEGTAQLYVFNDSGWTLIPSNQEVTDQGKAIASLPRQMYARFLITPGFHVLRPQPFLWKQEVTLKAEPGGKYYVVIGYKPERSWAFPFAGPPLVMKQLTEEEARQLMSEMKLQ